MEDFHFEPGFFTLPLVINRGHYSSVQVEYKKSVLERFLQKKLHRPERHAIRNLLGLLASRLEEYEEALDYFTQVESEDPTNLNALANRKSLCEILYRFNEASRCDNQLRTLLTTSETESKEGSDDEIDLGKRKARCLAEQAYAFAFDIFGDKEGCTRYLKSHQLYSAAMELAGDYVDTDERHDWEFADAFACREIYKSKAYAYEPHASYVRYLNISLRHFYVTIKSGDDDMKAESWRHMGEIFFDRRKKQPRPECVCKNPELEPYFNDPKRCVTKALEIAPHSPRLLTRLARIISLQNYDTDESLRLLRQSIEIDHSRYNRFAFAFRGDIYIKMYQKQTERYEHDKGNNQTATDPPDRKLLQLAKSDTEKALSLNVNSKELTNLARIWHYLAKDENGHVTLNKESKDCLDKALMYHAKAINCENGAMREDTNRHRGICLLDAKEYDAAIESFKRAMECQPETSRKPDTFFSLMKVYLTFISERESDESGSTRLLSELAYWAEEAITKYGVQNLRTKKATVKDFWYKMPREMNMFIDYCNRSGCHERALAVFSQPSVTRKTDGNNSGSAISRNSHDWHRVGAESNSDDIGLTNRRTHDQERQRVFEKDIRRSAATPPSRGNGLQVSTEKGSPEESFQTAKSVIRKLPSELNSEDKTNKRGVDHEQQRASSRDVCRPEDEVANPAPCGNRFQDLVDEMEEEASSDESIKDPKATKPVIEESSSELNSNDKTRKGSHEREHLRDFDRDTSARFVHRSQVLVGEETSPEESAQKPKAAKAVVDKSTTETLNETETSEKETNEDKKMVNPADIKSEEIPEPPEKARFSGHAYDFFAIYPDSAGDWVRYRLLTMLERVQRLKGCIKERDFMPGRYVVDNYSKCIETSASYLMIITKDFNQDGYCKYAMKQCLHPSGSDPEQPRRVIPVLAEECEIPKELAFKTHFKATGAPNWDLLVEAIQECADTPVLK